MALVRGGTFTMGDLFGEGDIDEAQHSVTVSDFYLGKTEVTFEEFDVFCAATGREKPADQSWKRGKLPIIEVDWYDAVEYCNWLSQQQKRSPAYTIDKSRQDPNNSCTYDEKKWIVSRNANANGYRLPTEAEWEYAAREGGKKVRFGNGIYGDKGNHYGMTYVEVGSLLNPNALGLHDMSGNVWEWCWDWVGDYPTVAQTNPTGPTGGEFRVARGGSVFPYPKHCRATDRDGAGPILGMYDRGFRVAASLP